MREVLVIRQVEAQLVRKMIAPVEIEVSGQSTEGVVEEEEEKKKVVKDPGRRFGGCW